ISTATYLQSGHSHRRCAESSDLTLKFPNVCPCRARWRQSQCPRVNIQEEPRLHALSLSCGLRAHKKTAGSWGDRRYQVIKPIRSAATGAGRSAAVEAAVAAGRGD